MNKWVRPIFWLFLIGSIYWLLALLLEIVQTCLNLNSPNISGEVVWLVIYPYAIQAAFWLVVMTIQIRMRKAFTLKLILYFVGAVLLLDYLIGYAIWHE